METLLRDLRYAARSLRRSPGFTAVAVVTLALGIGATTTMFSLVNALLLRPLPVPQSNQLVAVQETRSTGDQVSSFSYPRYADYRQRAEAFAGLAAVGHDQFTVRGADRAEVVFGSYVSGNFWTTLGLRAAHGRLFAFATDDREPQPVVVLGHGYWRSRFGADPAVIGRPIPVNGQQLTVVGIAPEEFTGVMRGLAAEVWVPISMYPALNPDSDIFTRGRQIWLDVVGRLKPGVSREQATAALATIALGIEPDNARMTTRGARALRLTGLPPSARGAVIGFMALLLAAAALVLGIAGANVAGMLLARSVSRGRELAIRMALGAGRGRVARQLLTENVLLWLLGGAAGTLLAWALTTMLAGYQPPVPVRIFLPLDLDPRVLLFTLLLSLLTGLAFGTLPALRASRPVLETALKNGARGSSAQRSRLRGALVVGQIAVSLLLLVAAGLFLRALQHALSLDPGFDARGVAVAALNLEPHGYDATSGPQLYRALTEAVERMPGVQSVALSSVVPLGFEQEQVSISVPGHEPADGKSGLGVDVTTVSGGYFRTLRIPLRLGREFTDADREGAMPVAIINQTFAERFWPGEQVLGKQIRYGDRDVIVVGVAADLKYYSLQEEARSFLYLPFAQKYKPSMYLQARTSGDVGRVLASIQREIAVLDPNLAVITPMPLSSIVAISLFPQQLAATLIGVFGLVGLLLAAVGIYGILAFAVNQRTREIGVRIALGARPVEVIRMVLRQGMRLVLVGAVLGLLAAVALTRFLAGLLYGIGPTDPLTFGGVAVLLLAVALLAGYFPARRATRVDPMIALRAE